MTAQRGVAVVVAMLVVALAALIATALAQRQGVALARTQALLAATEAQARAPALVATALKALPADAALPTELAIDGARVTVTSAQGCLNLNALIDPEGQDDELAERRLRALARALDQRTDFVAALADWIDADGRVRPGGAEDDYYSRRVPPRRAANGPLADLSELALVRHADRRLVSALEGHACALPPGTALDVNHASAPVWRAIAPELSAARARELVAALAAEPVHDLGALATHPLLSGASLVQTGLTATSEIYAMQVSERAELAAPVLTALVRRNGTQPLARRWSVP